MSNGQFVFQVSSELYNSSMPHNRIAAPLELWQYLRANKVDNTTNTYRSIHTYTYVQVCIAGRGYAYELFIVAK